MPSRDIDVSPEHLRHLVKLGDLDAFEKVARNAEPSFEVAMYFESVFDFLDRRQNLGPAVALAWATRYTARIREFPDENDEYRIWGTAWARRVIELALAAGRRDLSFAAADLISRSLPPVGRKNIWWDMQRYKLSQPE